MSVQRVVDAADSWIVDRSASVVAVFLLLTAVFAVGLGNVTTETGTEQFAEDVPEQLAFETVQERFEPAFGAEVGTTQLVQSGENVLDRGDLLRMLTALDRLRERPELRVRTTTSAAERVALQLDPNATTLDAQRRAVRRASPDQIDAAVRRAARENPQFTALLSRDFNPAAASASATVAVVEHDVPEAVDEEGETNPLTPIQTQAQFVVDSVGGDIRVFGAGTIAEEFASVIGDTLVIVVPAAVVLIVAFLVVAYRDLVDLLLGVAALGMAVVWTFGFMGLAGIAFNQILIAVPPLLLAVGIDYGIHAINRYREERADGYSVRPAMRRTTDQLLVAFAIVTATSVVGFLSNLASDLLPIRDFGLVAGVGIAFTALVFGVFLPAAKVLVDRLRDRYPIPTTSQRPLGAEGSLLGRALSGGVWVARRAPIAALVAATVLAAASAGYATGIDTTFDQENFLPPEETPEYLRDLPEPFRPGEYTVTGTINYLERTFETGEDEEVVLFVEGPMTRDDALEQLQRAGANPPDTFVTEDGRAVESSIVTVISSYAAVNPEFAELVRRNDRDGDGVPDDDLGEIYDALLASPFRGAALDFLAEDYRSARVVYAVEADADDAEVTADAREVADRLRFEATPTGNIVVFQAIADLILASALVSLAVALTGTAVVLVGAYWVFEGRPSLALANLVPIVVTVALLAGTMRLVGIALNAFTATVLSITIGLGVDYSVHVVHRFVDELGEGGAPLDALYRTVLGTGGALTGSVLTTVFGIGVLVLSIFPAIGQFGLLTGLSVVYAYLASLLVLPSALVLWARLFGEADVERDVADATGAGAER